MNPARIVDGQVSVYPYTLRMLVIERPGTSWPDDWSRIDLASVGCIDVQLVPRPDLQPGENCVEGDPEWVGEGLRQTWVVTAAPPPLVPDSLPRHIAEEVLLRHPHPVHGTQWDAVLALVASLPDEQRRIYEARLRAPSIRRKSTTVAAIALGLGWADDWVDDRFRDGAALEETV